MVYIPVTNNESRPCRWFDLRGKIEIVAFEREMEIVRQVRDANIIAALEAIEPDWHNGALESFD